MKLMLIFLLAAISFSPVEWQTDITTAKKLAREKNRHILLNFSGSDWCIPCIRLRKEIFNSDDFLKLADSSLILLNADFPRNKKNQLSKDQQRSNEALADLYNPSGKFPYTLLLTANGDVIQSWDGYPNSSSLFINQIKSACNAHHH